MAENHPPTEMGPATPTPGKPIPMGMKYHWWYDSKQSGVGNSTDQNFTGHSPPASNYSAMSQSPPAGGDMGLGGERRGSLKNMMHLYDFATP